MKRRTKKQFIHALDNGGTFPMTNQEVKWYEYHTRLFICTTEPPSAEKMMEFIERSKKQKEEFKNSINKFPFVNHHVGL